MNSKPGNKHVDRPFFLFKTTIGLSTTEGMIRGCDFYVHSAKLNEGA